MQQVIIYILTFILVLDCLFLGLLILMQLPKKDAGMAGAAFGGGAVDALIGAGSGNVLTKATKYSAVTFFVLIVSLSLLHANYARRNVVGVSQQLEAQKAATPAAAPANPLAKPAPAVDLPLPTSTSGATTPAPATTPTPGNKPADPKP